MSCFKQDYVHLKVPKSGDIRILEADLDYASGSLEVKIPKGFKTDLGSIPQILQNIFPKDGKAMFGYILHDYLYKVGNILTRDESDDELKLVMASLGVSWWRRTSVRVGLKLGGQSAWNKHRKNEKEVI